MVRLMSKTTSPALSTQEEFELANARYERSLVQLQAAGEILAEANANFNHAMQLTSQLYQEALVAERRLQAVPAVS